MSLLATSSVWENLTLTSSQKLVSLYIADKVNEENEWLFFGTQKRCVQKTGLDRKTVIAAFQELLSLGYLTLIEERPGKQNIYRFEIDKHKNPSTGKRSSPKNGTGTGPKNGTTSSPKNGTTILTKGITEEKTEVSFVDSDEIDDKATNLSQPDKPKKPPSDYKQNPQFMEFYDLYPRKQKPRDAYKAFLSVVGDDQELLGAILQDLRERIARHTQWQDKQYIPLPASYLRSGDYESEIINQKDEQKKREKEKLKAELEEQRRHEEKLKQSYKDAVIYRQINAAVKTQKTAPSKTLKDMLGWSNE